MKKKLERNKSDQMIAGVASGIGEHLDVDVTWIRLAFVLAVFAGLSGILIYIILWIAMPAKPIVLNTGYRTNDDVNYKISPEKKRGNGSLIAGVFLIFIGIYLLLNQFYLIPYWFSIHKLWPLVLIVPGILLLYNSIQRGVTETTDKEQKDSTTPTDSSL